MNKKNEAFEEALLKSFGTWKEGEISSSSFFFTAALHVFIKGNRILCRTFFYGFDEGKKEFLNNKKFKYLKISFFCNLIDN